jgi:lysophospholipase L1-like esterase
VLIKSNFISKIEIKLGLLPEEITNYYHTMVAFHHRVDKNLPDGSVLFIGDSHIQGLAVSAISPHSVNYGIGRDTTVGVINRLPYYGSLSSAKAVVLSIGFNDLRYRENSEIADNIDRILQYFSPTTTVVLCAIIPIDEVVLNDKSYNQRIINLNDLIREKGREYSNVIFLNIRNSLISESNLLPKFHIGDGIHLNKEGYDIWIYKLVIALNHNMD